MIIAIDQHDPTPPFEQIRRQIAVMAASGVLSQGHRLPPVRQLARDLGVAPNTVARAYRELEQAGWIITRGRHGSYVSSPPVALPSAERLMSDAIDRLMTTAAQLGFEPEAVVEMVADRLHSQVAATA